MIKKLSYTDFITMCATNNFPVGYSEKVDGLDIYYEMYTYDGDDKIVCRINNIDNETEVSDFETNQKDNLVYPFGKRNDFNLPVVAPSLEDVMGLYPKKKGRKAVVTAGDINFFDTEVLTEKRICGGEYWIKEEDVSKVHDDDYVEFSVIDKNDVLGLFSLYGLTVGQDILEITKFIITDYVKKGSSSDCYHSRLYEGIKGTNVVYQGLFMRAAYKSSGTEDLTFIWRMYYYE